MKYTWKTRGCAPQTGEAASRLYRFFKEDTNDGSDDKDDKVEHAFLWDYNSIEKVPDPDGLIDATACTIAAASSSMRCATNALHSSRRLHRPGLPPPRVLRRCRSSEAGILPSATG